MRQNYCKLLTDRRVASSRAKLSVLQSQAVSQRYPVPRNQLWWGDLLFSLSLAPAPECSLRCRCEERQEWRRPRVPSSSKVPSVHGSSVPMAVHIWVAVAILRQSRSNSARNRSQMMDLYTKQWWISY